MKAWPKIKLREVLTLDLHKEPIDASKRYEMVGVLSFGKGLFNREPIEAGNTSYKYFLRLKENHIVMSQLFGWEGALALSSAEFEGRYASPQFPTFVCDEDVVDRYFIGWVMRQPSFWSDLGSRAKGMGDRRRTLNPDALFESEMLLPPLTEQRAVVAHLDALAEKAQQVEAHIDAVDIESSALLLSLHHKLAGNRLVRLGDVIELFEQAEPVVPEGQYPQVGVRGFGGGLFAKAAITGAETSYRSFNRLYSDAIVLSQVKGWEGAIALCPPELDGMFVSPEYRTFRCKASKASSHYLGELVKTEWFWTRLQDATRGVGARRERTRPEQFLNIEIPLPLLADQLRIVKILAHQTPLRAKHTAIRNANAALVPATLERIFSTKERDHA